jgi:hypothetical protein
VVLLPDDQVSDSSIAAVCTVWQAHVIDGLDLLICSSMAAYRKIDPHGNVDEHGAHDISVVTRRLLAKRGQL